MQEQDEAIAKGQKHRFAVLAQRERMEANQRGELGDTLSDMTRRRSAASAFNAAVGGVQGFGRSEGLALQKQQQVLQWNQQGEQKTQEGFRGLLPGAANDPKQRRDIQESILQSKQREFQFAQQETQLALQRAALEKEIVHAKAEALRAEAHAGSQSRRGRAAAAGAGFAGIGQMKGGEQSQIRRVYAIAAAGGQLSRHQRDIAIGSGIPDLVNYAHGQAAEAGMISQPQAAAHFAASNKVLGHMNQDKTREAHRIDEGAEVEIRKTREQVINDLDKIYRSMMETFDAIAKASKDMADRARPTSRPKPTRSNSIRRRRGEG